jgi:hypothetical protein
VTVRSRKQVLPVLLLTGLLGWPQGTGEPPDFPRTTTSRPGIASPRTTAAGEDLIVFRVQDRGWCQLEVTPVNDRPYDVLDRVRGRGAQLVVDSEDFPTLAATGLHSEAELAATTTVTGRAVEEITRIGRPGEFSGAGFLAEKEDLLTVLREDNRIVSRLGLTHPRLAAPLFHIWNLALRRADHADSSREWLEIEHVLYNGCEVQLDVQATRGFQDSIFDDGIRGNHNLTIFRDPTPAEIAWLEDHYGHMGRERINEMIVKLGRIETGEMVPFYIMRYGFYEGHTPYRADPVAIAFIFGLLTLDQIQRALPGNLHALLTEPF